MKGINIIYRITWIALVVVVLSGTHGCIGDFSNMNRNHNDVTDEEMDRDNYRNGANIKALQNLVIPTQEHMYQFNEVLAAHGFCGYTATIVDNWTAKFSTYNPTNDWLKWPFNEVMIKTYPPYRAIVRSTEDPIILALADVLRVAIMHRMADVYGPIPYTQVMADKKDGFAVGYDSQDKAYMKMFEELDAAILAFNENSHVSSDSFGRFDAVYAGNISQWIKYSNSLKLRMAMRISEVEPVLAKLKAEEAISGGVILDNADNAAMKVEVNRAEMIYNSWGDHRVGADIICFMNGYADPRREQMFTMGTWGSGDNKIVDFSGVRIGIDPASKAAMVDVYSKPIMTQNSPFMWFNASEVAFLRAEGALRGWSMGGDAKTLYESAIQLSFDQHGASNADSYIANSTDMPLKYTDPLGQYSYTEPTSSITVAWETPDVVTDEVTERNLERIITQKWIAIYPSGVEAWSEHRRTGYPVVMPAFLNKSGGSVNSKHGMRRIPYPAEEYTLNSANIQEALTLLGGPDTGGTRVWWDVKPYKN